MKAKNVWRKPVLTIIKRFQPEENVLATCKGTAYSSHTLGQNGTQSGCFKNKGNCGNSCSATTAS